MQRYFVQKENIKGNLIIINGKDYHHIKNVMRMRDGECVYICDNDKCYISKIINITDEIIEFEICDIEKMNSELDINLTIAMGLVRKEKSEEVLRRIVELGASAFLNVAMERSIVRENKNFNYERAKLIVKEASEQSHRCKLLEVIETKTFKDFLTFSKDFDLCLFAYEEEGRNNNFTFKKYLGEFKGKNILILTGPEGGISSNEIAMLKKHNFKAIGLGPRILRCETAPLYVAAIVAHESENKRYAN